MTESPTDLKAAAALAVFERLAAAMCSRPDRMAMEVALSTGVARVKLRVHRDDVPNLVGRRGKHIKRLDSLLAMALAPELVVEIEDIEQASAEDGAERGVADDAFLEGLLKDVSRVCLQRARTAVESVRRADGKLKMTVLWNGPDRTDENDFAQGVSVLFLAVAFACGRKVQVDVRRVRA